MGAMVELHHSVRLRQLTAEEAERQNPQVGMVVTEVLAVVKDQMEVVTTNTAETRHMAAEAADAIELA